MRLGSDSRKEKIYLIFCLGLSEDARRWVDNGAVASGCLFFFFQEMRMMLASYWRTRQVTITIGILVTTMHKNIRIWRIFKRC